MFSSFGTKITIMMGARIGGNDNSRLPECLLALSTHAESKNRYEVLIKMDDDDPGLGSLKATIESFSDRVNIRYIVTPRGRGYADLHKAYLDLMLMASPLSEMFWVLSDDVMVAGHHWDRKLLDCAAKSPDGVFVITPTAKVDYSMMAQHEALNTMENYPVWSRGWVGICGGFGYTFSTDGWTNLICWKLVREYGLDPRLLPEPLQSPAGAVPSILMARTRGAQDVPGSERWNTARKEMFDKVLSAQVQSLLDYTVHAIARAKA